MKRLLKGRFTVKSTLCHRLLIWFSFFCGTRIYDYCEKTRNVCCELDRKCWWAEWFGWAVSASTYHVWFSITRWRARWHLALNPFHTFPAFSTGWNYEWESLNELNAGETLPAAPAQQRFRSYRRTTSNNTPYMCDRSTETTNTSLTSCAPIKSIHFS